MNGKKIWKTGFCLFLSFLLAAAPLTTLASELELSQASEEATTQAGEETTTEKPEETTTQKPEETTTQKPEETTTQKPEETTTEKPEDTTGSGDVGGLQGKRSTVVSVSLKGGKNPVYNGEILKGSDFLNVVVKEELTGNTIKNPELRYIYYKYNEASKEEPRQSDYLKEAPINSGRYWVEVFYKGDAGHKIAYGKPLAFTLEKVTPEILLTTNMTEETLIGDTITLTVQLKMPGKEGVIDAPEGTIVFKENGKVLNEAIPFKDGKSEFEYVLPSYEVDLSVTYVQSPLSWVVQNYKNGTYVLENILGKKRNQFGIVVSTTHKVYGNEPFKLDMTGGEGTGAYAYQSSDTSVATVAEDGTITILHPGTTYITVTKAGDDTYNETSKAYGLIVGKGVNPDKPKKIVEKEVSNKQITVNVVKGQEYSINGGNTWNTTGVFTGLKPNKDYTVITRLCETEYYAASSKTRYLKLKTTKQKLNKADQEVEVNHNSKGPLGSLGGNKKQQITTATKVTGSTSKDKTRKVNTLTKEDADKTASEEKKAPEEASTEAEEATTQAALEETKEKQEKEKKEEPKRSATQTVKAGMSVLVAALCFLAFIYFRKRETNL